MAEPLLWTTAKAAEELAASEDFVRDHAGELGGIRLGRGPRSPLRFKRSAVEAWLDRQAIAAAAPPPETTSRSRKPQVPAGIDLLPLPGKSLATADK